MRENNDVNRWTAKCKAALFKGIIRDKTNASEPAREFDLKPSETQQWVDEAEAGMENALRANPRVLPRYTRRRSTSSPLRTERRCWS